MNDTMIIFVSMQFVTCSIIFSSIVECDPEELNGWIGKVLRSEGNVVGISQLTNPFVRRDRIGVQISYRKIGPTTYGSTGYKLFLNTFCYFLYFGTTHLKI